MKLGKFQFEWFPKKYGWFPYVWPIYLILPFFNIRGEHGIKLWIGCAMIVLFAVTYRQLYWVTGKVFNLWLALQMALILALCMFYSPYNFYLGFFTSNFIGWYTDHKKFHVAISCFAAVEVLSLLFGARNLVASDLPFMLPFLVIMLVMPYGIRSMSRRQQLERELDRANEQIKELIKREERMRIARDLHDTLGHTLSLITLKSQLVEKLAAKDAERAQAEAREIQRTSRAALRQVRELVSDMRAITVAEALAEASEILRAADIALDVEGDPRLAGVSDLMQNIVSLCIKEAVTNIVKHSRATRCVVTIETAPAEVRLQIEDNGIGLSSGKAGSDRLAPPSSDSVAGNGLKGMAERLSLIDGTLTVGAGSLESADGSEAGVGQGTRLQITIPLIVKEAAKEGETA
ncbi:sensor histidine kinase [Paenibacillus barengoltzii]|uniref:histidine kinase n=1 Tax=Paenibacillus barengoltzii J12 TaxID=935846 RepID=A0ABY1LXB2_9BACL|nr:sensor histidine kinase [Paenibacillus barengoltzii]SMF25408.1 two-component system, NarL family, sensor histidine kinase DesK [Paenibacillus barengoltzii J12]